MAASLAMHHVRLLLASALLIVGCAADDSPGAGATSAAVTPARPADGAAAAEPDSEGAAPGTDATPDSTATVTAATAAAAPTTGTNPADGTATTDTATPTTDTATPTTAAPTTTAPTTDTGTNPADGTATTDTAAPTTAAPTTAAPTTAAPTTAVPEPSIDGFAVFLDATCDSCHRGDGDGTGADLRASTLDRDAVIEVIRFGVADTEMDGWDFEPKPPGLTREEIEAVADYVLTLRSG